MKLLLISNSTNPGENYLEWTLPFIEDFLKNNKIKTALFVPYAGVKVKKNADALEPKTVEESYDNLFYRANDVFKTFGIKLESIHQADNPIEAVEKAECVIVSGGNTFHLVYELHRKKLMSVIRKRALNGMPYIGWSAGSNIACPTLRTTNDMPIIEPESFNCLNLVPFQINPHYLDTDKHPKNFGGETREDRINEFLAVNKEVTIIGLREASLLEVNGEKMELKAKKGVKHGIRVFQHGKEPKEVPQGDISKFLK
jgi:dipeptidase E